MVCMSHMHDGLSVFAALSAFWFSELLFQRLRKAVLMHGQRDRGLTEETANLWSILL